MTPEEAQLTGQMNALLENNLSSVKISTKIEMKTKMMFVEWDIKAKHEDVHRAKEEAEKVHLELKEKYYGSK